MVLHIAGYKFIQLQHLQELQVNFRTQCIEYCLLGTILLSHEGININLAGEEDNISAFLKILPLDQRFADMNFHQSFTEQQPYARLKIKIKPEIITLRQAEVDTAKRAPAIEPETLKQWLDSNKDITLLDTRNDYEVRFGTFTNAVNLHLQHFTDFPQAIKTLERKKPVVMFCTGGIRCEKAALHMMNEGFEEVYQLDGGILGYFAKMGGEHYDGDCFVFDERIALDPQMQISGKQQCQTCQGPVNLQHQASTKPSSPVACPACS